MKIKIFIVLSFIPFFSFCQSNPAQQETIDWLKEKIVKYYLPEKVSYKKIEFISINITPCDISISTKTEYSKRNGGSYYNTCTITFPTSANWNYGKNWIEAPANVIHFKQYDELTDKLYDGYGDNLWFASNEENIYERLAKALKHLATFCTKPKEAF